MDAIILLSFSTMSNDAAPRDASSREILPVPPKRSSVFISSNATLFCKILNKPSFAKSVVGLVKGILEGVKIFRPPYFPEIIRIISLCRIQKNNAKEIR